MSEKLQKVLARAGQGSRREIELMIQNGRVSVDGDVAKLGDRLEDMTASVRIDGRRIELVASTDEVCRVLAYNKPEGELCTRHNPEGRRTVFDCLPRLNNGRWVSVGRLDANTSGMLLFTTDGELANRLMHPSHSVQREYMVRVFGEISEDMVRNLVRGVELEDGMARFEDVVYAGGEGMNHTFYVVITEGRNREVRRLWASQGVTVSRLKRVRYGDIYLSKELPRGGWMELELNDVNYLRELVGLQPETETELTVEGQKRKRNVRQIRRAVRRFEERADNTNSRRRNDCRSTTRNSDVEKAGNDKPRRPSTRSSDVDKAGNQKPRRPSTRNSGADKAENNKPRRQPRQNDADNKGGNKARKPAGNGANRRNPLASKPTNKPRTRK
ncbi:23S rRNA pseudouridine(2605) synthase RluB [Photobacterium damselae subsp. piscicida]|nr:23S rRNA pseudouridine(2605) synthase RluB [Photobacterium damselae subsp. piscicida]MDP2533014.1 23S rRNA pseudouridine(2605) synthase RluB [Photobacterium damselae subsp. piscicida]MDP2543930.1 23S rRNA pseudouridine(2605) synthase RluB [Photobacterium damselae subsp. piscicida]MDP2569858.1 23S rRNA pseudouridine(2605) synthase RluB [Photobacterium damselae subsp. piscicida]